MTLLQMKINLMKIKVISNFMRIIMKDRYNNKKLFKLKNKNKQKK